MRYLTARIATSALLVAAAATSAATPPTATNGPGGELVAPFLASVEREVLPNGLTVLVRSQPGSGVVAINTWVKAGYFHEPDEVAGMAHLFEHMFFKGSERFPDPEAIMLEVASLGGVSNAGTIYDSTNYYFVVPREGFRKGLEIQADAIMHPRFDPAELEKEAEVVIEESNRKLDNAPAVAIERMYATAFTQHRMKRWRIGSNEVLRNIKRENLLAFFETLYRPENIVLVVAGDVTAEEAMAAARSTFGAIPRGTPKKQGGPAEPAQSAMRFGRSEADVRTAYSVYGWHTPGPLDPDRPALDVLAGILADGRASRLYRGAVGPTAASDIQASNDTFEELGFLTILAALDEPNREETDRRVLAEIERLRVHGPTAWEVTRAANRVRSNALFGLGEVLGQAQTLAQMEARSGYRDLAGELDHIAAVTPERVREVARKYLGLDELTLYHYQPTGAAAIDAATASSRARAAVAGPFTAEPPTELPAAVAALPRAGEREVTRDVKLPNGLRLIVRERAGAPTVTMGIFFPGGRVDESSRNAGITQLMASAMRRGTATRSGDDLDREIEFLGTGIDVAAEPDFFGLSLGILAPAFPRGAELLADVVMHPAFPAEGVDEERYLQIATVRRNADSGIQRPTQLVTRAFYGPHPYGLAGEGYVETVTGLSRDDVATWWRERVGAAGATVIVVGDVQAAAVERLVTQAFANMPVGMPRTPAAAPQPPTSPIEIVESRDRRQTAMVVAFPAVSPRHADWPALRLLQSLTTGLTGTFGIELRGRRSLAYTVFTQAFPHALDGAFIGYLASDAAKEAAARDGLLEQFAGLADAGIQPEAVERAKRLLAGSTRIRLETNAAQAGDIAQGFYVAGDMDATAKLLAALPALTTEGLRDLAKRTFATPAYAAGVLRGRAPAAPAPTPAAASAAASAKP